jgi:lipopolysaccharide export system protein LptA
VYDDAGRVATYTTGARIADARGARDLTADKIELFLAPKASEVQRLEAYGAVTVKEPARTASGTRLTYTAEDDKYVMTGTVGTPVIVVEQKPGGGCQKSQGTRLVFRQAVEGFTLDEMKHINPCTAGPAR